MKKYRYMVAWDSETAYVTCATTLEAIKAAADQFHINWKHNVEDMIVTPLREVKERAGSW